MQKLKEKFFSTNTLIITLVVLFFTTFNGVVGQTFLVTIFFGIIAIRLFQKLKAQQTVRNDSSTNHLKKNGTLTLGGVIFIPSIILVSFFNSYYLDTKILPCLLITVSYMLIGLVDDSIVIKEQNNRGLKARYKLLLEGIFASIFMFWLITVGEIPTLTLPFGESILLPEYLYFCLGLFTLVGFANASNITDGIDGLCTSTTIIVALGLLVVTPNNPTDILLFSMIGACLGFLVFNFKTAIIFMGDTGSLPIGSLLASQALITGNILPLIIIGLVFVLETLSVIIQISYFKYTRIKRGQGVRIFKKAPYHHTMEEKGFSEVGIVIIACILTSFTTLVCWKLF